MGLFDNLFKPKSSAAPEEIAESEENPANPAAKLNADKAPEVPPPPPKPPTIPPPSAFGQRSLGHVVMPGPAPRKGPAERRIKAADAADDSPRSHEIVIILGDVLDRLPARVLTPGPHDAHRELRFRLDDLAADIARGRAAIPLSQIAEQCPDIFLAPITEDDDVFVRLPLQKLVDQIGATPGRAASAPPAPVPLFEPPTSLPPAAELTITLRLAAIMRTCPPEIIAGDLPAIGEAEVVTFPFAPVERQLPNGRVDVSSARFVAALPPHLRERFRAADGVRIPLPLDEIFLNLPGQKAAPPPTPMPVVAVEPPKVEPPKVEAPPVEKVEIKAPAPAPALAMSAPGAEVSQSEIDDLRKRIAALRAEIGAVAPTPAPSAPPTPRFTPPAAVAETLVAPSIFRSPLVPPVVVNPAAVAEAKIEPPPPVMLPVRAFVPPVWRNTAILSGVA